MNTPLRERLQKFVELHASWPDAAIVTHSCVEDAIYMGDLRALASLPDAAGEMPEYPTLMCCDGKPKIDEQCCQFKVVLQSDYDALRAAKGQRAGWVSVPVEPTEAMLAAGTMHDSMDENSDIGADVAGIYKSMLSAKPAGGGG